MSMKGQTQRYNRKSRVSLMADGFGLDRSDPFSMSTRPMFSKVSLAAFVLILVLAANIGSKADDLLPQLRKNYEDCVYRAVRSQAEKLRSTGGTSEAIELAFEACQSEEREIVEHLNAIGMAPDTVDKALRAFKLRLQKTVR